MAGGIERETRVPLWGERVRVLQLMGSVNGRLCHDICMKRARVCALRMKFENKNSKSVG